VQHGQDQWRKLASARNLEHILQICAIQFTFVEKRKVQISAVVTMFFAGDCCGSCNIDIDRCNNLPVKEVVWPGCGAWDCSLVDDADVVEVYKV